MQGKKLFYVPGLISLIGLPILLLLFGPEEEVRQTAVRLFMPYDEPKDEEAAKFSKATVYESIKGKNIIAIHGEETQYDQLEHFRYNRKMNFIGSELERLQFTHDTNAVLKVEFDEENAYGDFVHVLNLAILYRVRRYTFVDNSLFLFPDPHPTHQKIYLEEIEYQTFSIPEEAEPSRWEEFRYWLDENASIAAYMIKRNYLLVAAFVVLIIAPSLVKLIRSRKSHLANDAW
jgi:hypothetical protein